MGYNVKYIVEYKNKNNDTITIDILKKDYIGSVTRIENIESTVSLKYRPSEDSPVIGSELTFSFVTKNKDQFQDLLTSNHKDYKAEFYLNGVLNWSGFLVIDNITTSYSDYVYSFNLSFADSLAELDRFYVTSDDGSEIAGRNSLLWYIKNSIKHTDLALDFAVVLNTKEVDYMTAATDNALAKALLSSDRFKEIADGNKEITDAKTVINEILKVFNCKLYQANNKFYIVNDLEVASTLYHYDFATLALQGTTINSNGIDITNKHFEKGNMHVMERPLKNVKAKYLNKNIPQNLIPDGDFSTNDTSFWNFIGGFMGIVDGELLLDAGLLVQGETQVHGTLTSTPISIAQKTNNDVIRVSFDYTFRDVYYGGVRDDSYLRDATNWINLKVELMMGEVVIAESGTWMQKYMKSSFSHDFAIVGNGLYHVRISDYGSSEKPYDRIVYSLDNFSFLSIIGTDEGTGEADNITTFDELFSTTNIDTSAIDKNEELEIILGDGLQENDISNLFVNEELTSRWKSYNRNENCKLQQLYTINLLRQKQRYRNKITITVISEDFAQIFYDKHILFDGKRYSILDYTVNYSPILYSYNLTLVELFTDEINYEFSTTQLRSVNGEKPDSELNITEVDPTVPSHVKAITIEQITNWNNSTGDWNTLANKPGSFPSDWSTTANKPATFTPATHTHAIADITNLQTTLNGKAASSHTHSITNVTNLQTTLDGKASTVHTHSWNDIVPQPDFAVNGHTHTEYVAIVGSTMTGKLGVGIAADYNLTVKDAANIKHDGNTDNSQHLELFTAQGSAYRSIGLRFHQDQRHWHTLKTDTNGFHFVDGADGSYDYRDIKVRNVVATNQITAFSDSKLKTNIRDYENGLDKLMLLKPVVYDRTDIESDAEVGFIAQAVKEVEPTVVYGIDTLSLDYSRLVVMLTKAVQELKAEVDTLKNKRN